MTNSMNEPVRRTRYGGLRLAVSSIAVAAILAGCGSSAATPTTAATAAATTAATAAGSAAPATAAAPSCAAGTTLKVAYGSTYVMFSPDITTVYWTDIKAKFEAAYPGAKIEYTPIPGVYNDIITKMSLLYRSADTAPDLAELPTDQLGVWVDAGYLMPLDDHLATADWWQGYTDVIKVEGKFNGKVYAVSQGENDSALWYNKSILQQAGVTVPFVPKTWKDIIDAAKAVKAKVPNVSPFYIMAGNANGTNGILLGGGNLLPGASGPAIQDSASGKWIVDSPGLRDVLDFYHQIAANGLSAPISQVLSDQGTSMILNEFPKGTIAMSFGGNYNGQGWTKMMSVPFWADAPTTVGVVPIPTITGQGSGVSSLIGGWDLALYSGTTKKECALALLDLMQSKANMAEVAVDGGFVPPNPSYSTESSFLDAAPPFQKVFADIIPFAQPYPHVADYSVWAYGFNQATEQLMQDPSTTVDQAIKTMTDYVTNPLGADKVIVLK